MLRKTLITAILSMVLPLAGESVSGQVYEGQDYDQGNCGSCNQGAAGQQKHRLFCPQNCGRGITTSQAAALWTGYCSEECGFEGGGAGHGCRLFGGCRSRGCGHGCGTGCGLFKGRARHCGSGSATADCTFGYDSCAADVGNDCCGGSAVDCGCMETSGQGGCKLFSCFKKKSSCGGRSCKCRLFNHHGGSGSCYQDCTAAPCGCDAYVSTDSGCGCSGGCGTGCCKRKGSKGCGLFHGGRSNDCGNVSRGCCFSRGLHQAGRKGCEGGFFGDSACCSSGDMGLYSGGCASGGCGSGGCDGSMSIGKTAAPVNGAVAPVPPATEPAAGGAVIEGQIQGSPIGDGTGGR